MIPKELIEQEAKKYSGLGMISTVNTDQNRFNTIIRKHNAFKAGVEFAENYIKENYNVTFKENNKENNGIKMLEGLRKYIDKNPEEAKRIWDEVCNDGCDGDDIDCEFSNTSECKDCGNFTFPPNWGISTIDEMSFKMGKEFAEQELKNQNIDFTNWILKENYISCKDRYNIWWQQGDDDNSIINSEELFNLYLKGK